MTAPTIIDQIKQATDLAQLIGQTYTLTGRDGARTRSTVEHDSLIIWTDTNTWRWFSQNIGGDCLDWVQHRDGCTLADAIEILAQPAGIERRPLTPAEQDERTQQQRHHAILTIAAQHHHNTLLHHPDAQPARDYCQSRAWTPETITAEMIGCTLALSGDNTALSPDPDQPLPQAGGGWEGVPLSTKLREADLLDHPTARAVLSIPYDMLVYVHRRGGRVEFISGRSIEDKRHYHLPNAPTPAYHNSVRAADPTLLVEGQADAISLAQLGVPAVALCGLYANDAGTLKITHIALDADEPGHKRALAIAQAIDPMIPIVEWQPIAGQPVKDANDALLAGADGLAVFDLIHDAKPALLHMAAATRRLTGDLRTEAQRNVLDAYLSLDELVAADLKPKLADALGEGISQLGRLLKARKEELDIEALLDAKANPDDYEQSAGGNIGGVLFEQCVRWHPDGSATCLYAVRWPDGTIETRDSVTVGGVTYSPYPGRIGMIRNENILFPEEPVAYTDQRALLREVQDFIHTYLDVDPFYERLASYYVLFSWLYDCFDTLPYLRALGDAGTGKSRFLQTIGSLCYRPMFMSGATTVSPVFRLLALMRGTTIIDEADFSNSDTDNEMIKILNLGFDRRQGFVWRDKSEGDTHFPESYNVYGPKLLATRKEFTDKATESRCLTKRMSTARPDPRIPYVLDDRFWLAARALRNKLLTHRLLNHKPRRLDNSMAEESIEPRLNQVMMALKATIDDPAMKHELTAFMIAYNQEMIGKRGMQLPALVLQAVVDIYYGPTDLYGDKDFSMTAIANRTQQIITEWDPDERVSARRVAEILLSDLGLAGRDEIKSGPHKGRKTLSTTDEELQSLMVRWGITTEETAEETTEETAE